MNRRFYTHIFSVLVVLVCRLTTQAQVISERNFAEDLTIIPRPAANMELALEEWNNQAEADGLFRDAYATLNESRDIILHSFFETFIDHIYKVKANKILLNEYSADERKMMESFQLGSSGMDEEGQFETFKLVMETHPPISSRKLSWAKMDQQRSESEEDYYQQLLQIEKSLHWEHFKMDADERQPLKHMLVEADALNEINEQFIAQRGRIPSVKVKPFEGINQTIEMEDPARMVALIETTEAKRRQIFERKYNALYVWWKEKFESVSAAAIRMDELLEVGRTRQGNQQQLTPITADVQERIYYMLIRLTEISQALLNDVQMARGSDMQKEEMVKMYKEMMRP